MQAVDATRKEFDFASYIGFRRQLVETKLVEYLAISAPEQLRQSMCYSVLSGGKRLRAILCLASAEAIIGLDQDLEPFIPCSCALEMIHAMSLIHDDLPAMDNDDFRRGKPTNHKVYGEAMALLAGDALLMQAIETLIKYTPQSIERSLLLEVVNHLCQATGACGMVGGQVLDLSFTGKLDEWQTSSYWPLGLEAETIEAIHKGKTGALIQFAVWSGARLAGANKSQLDSLLQFAYKLGLAFQIADDLLDVTGNFVSLGKTPGKDRAANKITWVTAFGENKAAEKLQILEAEALAILDKPIFVSNKVIPLQELLKYAVHREN